MKEILMKKKTLRFITILIGLLTIINLLIGYSYAYFSKSISGRKVEFKVGSLNYNLTSSDLDSNYQLQIDANDEVIIDVDVESLNDFASKYQMYYASEDDLSDLVIGYSFSSKELPSGRITENESKKVTLVIENNSSSKKTVTIGVSGGLDKYETKDIVLNNNQYRITEEIEKEKIIVLGKSFSLIKTTDTFPNYLEPSSETNGKGIYKYTEDGEDIYYWRGAVNNNHVIFGGYCWEMVRTTSTGGVKLIYDGEVVDSNCTNTGNDSIISISKFNQNQKSPMSVGYMYGNYSYYYKMLSANDTLLSTPGILYGYDVEFDGTNYFLKPKEQSTLFSSSGILNADITSIANKNHYTCFNTLGKCERVSYIYYTGNSNYLYYIDLSGGVTIEEALNNMYNNELSSTAKTEIESWFNGSNLMNEENFSKLDDVVYCNDRSMVDGNSGWSKDGDSSIENIYFSSYMRKENGIPSLDCDSREDNRDRFTYQDTVNGNGKLTYPVGLLTADEVMLAGGQSSSNKNYYLYTGMFYWSLSPYYYTYNYADEFVVNDYGILGNNGINAKNGLRPVISLKSDTRFISGGDGTETNPYIVK